MDIEALVSEHTEYPARRVLQKRLAEEVTVMVHGREAYETAVEASKILFSNQASEVLRKIDEDTLLAVMEGVERHEVSRDSIVSGEIKLVDLLTDMAPVFSSKGEMRKMTQQGALSINKEKENDPYKLVDSSILLNDKYILVQRGKKNYSLLIAK